MENFSEYQKNLENERTLLNIVLIKSRKMYKK